ncbi:MAG TPA: primase-helicase family protein [Chryseolinea sp.]|nr:primase-helicase family protein [Chryseolinea sp.]
MVMLDGINSLEDYIDRYQTDGVIWKATSLLSDIAPTDVRRHDNVMVLVHTLSLVLQPILRDDYIRKISGLFSINHKTLQKLVNETLQLSKKKTEVNRLARKNNTTKLEGDPTIFRFFTELIAVKKDGENIFKGIKIDKVKFIELLSHFGFARFEPSSTEDGTFIFVRITDNVIKTVSRDQIIDFLETFIRTRYRFSDAGYQYTDADILLNHFYERINHHFSQDLFARVRTTERIVIHSDSKDTTFLYYKNGYVEISSRGMLLRKYDEMDGSIWEHQMLDRDFVLSDVELEVENHIPIGSSPDASGKAINVMKAGLFADFCYKISNSDFGRFKSLCSIIGYVIHAYYQYGLKAIVLTDSTISEESNGRTGKTLLAKMIGMVRSSTEINGKDFDSSDRRKYQNIEIGTQVIHVNDVKHRGKGKFEIEDVFNDITEGVMVGKLYRAPFRLFAKMMFSTNRTLNIQGDSQKDRVVEFELSSFFNAENKPDKYYGQWFGRDWDAAEWNKFDNFMSSCAQAFHQFGIIPPAEINLGERKLVNHTSPEFIQFMDEIRDNLKSFGMPWPGYFQGAETGPNASCEIGEFEFDKKRLYERCVSEIKELREQKWFTSRLFYKWLNLYSKARFGIDKPSERKSNGAYLIRFAPED